MCFVAAEYLADPCERDGYSEEASDRASVHDWTEDIDCVAEACPDDDPLFEHATDSNAFDDDVWHVRSSSLGFDDPDAQQFDEEPSLHDEAPSEPEVKKLKVDQTMVPTFMGDTGFEIMHLGEWRRAETKLGIINAAAKQTLNRKVTHTPFPSAPSLLSHPISPSSPHPLPLSSLSLKYPCTNACASNPLNTTPV